MGLSEQEIAFDIVESSSNNNKEEELELIWLDGRMEEWFDELYEVTQQGMDALESQLQRLLSLYDSTLQPLLTNDDGKSTSIPRNELDTILRYYKSLVRALGMAVEAYKTYDYHQSDADAGALDDLHHDDNDDDDEEEQEVLAAHQSNNGGEEYKLQENDDDDDDDDDDDEWSSDKDCPGGLFVKGRCVTDIGKWEEL